MFAGFSPDGLRLLSELAANNERTWFCSRKERYRRELHDPMRAFVTAASEAFAASHVPLYGDDRSIFRVYRDVRFRTDKRPYRTSVAAYLSYDGGRATQGGLYVHVEPRAHHLSIAFYKIEKAMLRRWRDEMTARPARFRGVVRALRRRGLEIGMPEDWDDALKRMPRGFERCAKSELAPFFRLRSFCLRRSLQRRDVTSAALVARSLELVRDARPLLEFGWSLD